MTAAAFDALATAHTLEEAGVECQQAEAIAGAMRQATEADRDQLATKADLAALKAEIKAELKAEIAALKAEMLKVAVGAVAAIVLANAGLTVALIELLR